MNVLPEQDEEERRARRAKRREEMHRMKEQQIRRRMLIKKATPFVCGGIAVLVLCLVCGSIFHKPKTGGEAKAATEGSTGAAVQTADGSMVESSAADGGNAEAESGGAVSGSAEAGNGGAASGKAESSAAGSGNTKAESDRDKAEETESAGTAVRAGTAAVRHGRTAASQRQAAGTDINGETAGTEAGEDNPAAVGGQGGLGGNIEPYSAEATDSTAQLGGEIVSSNAVLIDLSSDTILAQKAAKTRISPASMTKVLTVLVAAEHVQDLNDTFTITIDITDYSYVHDCSNTGFAVDETVTVKDLFYGTILPSGADAAVGLATYVAGSQEAFVELMNEKLKELGLSDTAHFTNCVGLYDENHYCTVYDMAVILKAAVDNELCREVLSAHTYTTTPTTEHPEGITISNWFLRRIEDKDTGGEVVCGKTGYVVQSGNCAASYAESGSGKGYLCVTADATSGWKCIYDHVALYKEYMK